MFAKKIKIKLNNKEETKPIGKLLKKLKETIILLNNLKPSDESYKNRAFLLQKIEKSLDALLLKINFLEPSKQQETQHENMIFPLRQIEMLIDDSLLKIGSLEEIARDNLRNEIVFLQMLKKKTIDTLLMLTQNKSKTIDELIFSKLTKEYLESTQHDNLHDIGCIRAVKQRANDASTFDEKQKIFHLETNEKAFKNNLIKYTLSKEDNNLYGILCAQAFYVHSLLQKESFLKVRSSRKYIENIKFALSKKQSEDFRSFENLMNKNGSKEKICKHFLGINHSQIDVNCISLGNNYIFKLTDENNFSFVFMCTKIPQENILALPTLQHSAAKKYLAPEWYATSYHDTHSRNQQYYRYSLTSWSEKGNFENFAINLMLDEQFTLEEKQQKIITSIISMIMMVLNIRAVGVIISDLKPSNFLIDDDDQPYLSDIKTLFINDLNETIDWSRFDATESYIPPEQVTRGDTTYQSNECKDLDRQQTFMFGIMLYQMMNGWSAKELKEIMASGPICYSNGECHLPFDETIFDSILGAKVKRLIQKMVYPQQEERPTLREVCHDLNKYLTSSYQLSFSFKENLVNQSFFSSKINNNIELPHSTHDENIENSNRETTFNPALSQHGSIEINSMDPCAQSKLKKEKAVFFHVDKHKKSIQIIESPEKHNSVVKKN